jgi:ABC-type dipeptide/oligopeptide/nickel transport system ATPase subunit
MTSPAIAREIATASALETADVVVNFQGLRAIDRVSLRLDSGEVLGLIGPNGAGKTTLVNVLTGFQEADSGSVHLGGRDIGRWPPHERSRRGLVRTFQNVLPFAAPYTATKYAIEGLSESYRYELSATGVDVVIVEPGGFRTNFWSELEPPADAGRGQSYGSLAELPQKMYGGIAAALHQESAPDPNVVAGAVLKIIETPVGQRPLRLVVDPMMGGEGPRTINQLTDQIQAQLLTSLGLADLLTL